MQPRGISLWMTVCGLLWTTAAFAEKKPIRLAVMDFTPAASSSEFAPLGAGLQSMITTDLGQVTAFVIVERARLKDIEAELKLHESNLVDRETAAKIGGLAGASHLLVGSFTVIGGKMRIDARLFAVSTGEIVMSTKKEGPQTSFFELEQGLVKNLIDAVSVRLVKKEKVDLQKAQTQDFEAFAKFSEGLVLFDAKNGEAAVAAMQAALKKDPSFTLASTKLAEFQAALPMIKPPEPPKPPPAPECKQNPLQQPSCSSDPEPRAATMVMGDGARPYKVVVRASGAELTCMTPCPLFLPKGRVELDFYTPDKHSRTLDAPGGPSTIQVSRLNKTHIIVGGVLAGLTLAMVGATVGIHESSDPYVQPYWVAPLALATGLAFPAVYYLLKMGKTDAKLVSQ